MTVAHSPSSSRQRLLRALIQAVLLALVACGGGVETGGTGASGAAYAEGPITGFGSIIVGGVRFDESTARIEDTDGSLRSRSDLRLGMVVQVESGRISTDASGGRTGTASTVRLGAELLGPVTALDLANSRVEVLGQVVRLTTSTALDGVPGGASALSPGSVVEVQGFFDASSTAANYVATRVDLRTAMPASYRVRGAARQVDSGARTLRIGTQVFDLAASGVPAGLVDGVFVRLVVQTAQVSGRWPVVSAAIETRRLPDRDEAEVEGLITDFTNAAAFAVNGIAVQTSSSTSFPQGSAGLGLGVRVRVEGRASAGALVATSVSLRSDDDALDEGVDLRDAIANLDATARTFTLRGVTVFYGTSPAPNYVGGSEADLANGRNVRVLATLAADRTRVVATRIEFVNN
jgi:hypothetical protein